MKILKLKDITTAKREPLEVNKKLAYLAQWHDPRFVKWINNQNIISFKAKVYMLFLLCQSVYLVAKGVLSPNGLKALLYTAHKTILIKDGMQWKIFSQRFLIALIAVLLVFKSVSNLVLLNVSPVVSRAMLML